MSSYGKLEHFSPESVYNPKNKLALHIYDRSKKAFARAERRRARVKTADDFYKYQKKNVASLKKALGDIPYDKSLPLNAMVVDSFVYMDVTIEKIIFESRPGVFVTANLYLPNGREGCASSASKQREEAIPLRDTIILAISTTIGIPSDIV